MPPLRGCFCWRSLGFISRGLTSTHPKFRTVFFPGAHFHTSYYAPSSFSGLTRHILFHTVFLLGANFHFLSRTAFLLGLTSISYSAPSSLSRLTRHVLFRTVFLLGADFHLLFRTAFLLGADSKYRYLLCRPALSQPLLSPTTGDRRLAQTHEHCGDGEMRQRPPFPCSARALRVRFHAGRPRPGRRARRKICGPH
jgi:hypothetical protein